MSENLFQFADALSKQLEAFVGKEIVKDHLAKYRERLEVQPLDYAKVREVLTQLLRSVDDESRTAWNKRVPRISNASGVSKFMIELILSIGNVDRDHVHSCEGHQCILGSMYFAVLDGLLGDDISHALVNILHGMVMEQQVVDFFQKAMAEQREQQARIFRCASWGSMMQDPLALELMARILHNLPLPRRSVFLEKMIDLVAEQKAKPSLEDLEAMAQYVMGRTKNVN